MQSILQPITINVVSIEWTFLSSLIAMFLNVKQSADIWHIIRMTANQINHAQLTRQLIQSLSSLHDLFVRPHQFILPFYDLTITQFIGVGGGGSGGLHTP